MEDLINFFYNDKIFIFLQFSTIVIIIWLIYNQRKLSRLEKKYMSFINKFEGTDIEKTLKDYFSIINQVNEENKILIANNKNIEKRIDSCIQKVGIVRYNAFDDVGSDLSFAIALLDYHDNGIVINGIYSRSSSNIYSKPVINGESEYVLSSEEKEAIEKAKNQRM